MPLIDMESRLFLISPLLLSDSGALLLHYILLYTLGDDDDAINGACEALLLCNVSSDLIFK